MDFRLELIEERRAVEGRVVPRVVTAFGAAEADVLVFFDGPPSSEGLDVQLELRIGKKRDERDRDRTSIAFDELLELLGSAPLARQLLHYRVHRHVGLYG